MSTNNSNGSITGWIHDGYTRIAFIAKDPSGLYPDVSITYRPMLVQDQAVIFHEMEKADPRRRQSIAADAIRQRIVTWDLKGIEHGKTEDILKIQPRLFNRMFDIIMGYEGGDPNPDEDIELSNTEQSLADALRGPTVSLREEETVKN